MNRNEVIEVLADIEHQRWSGWQKYLHSLCIKNDDGSLTIPASRVKHWERQIETPYSELSEHEQEMDRKEARTSISAIEAIMERDGLKLLDKNNGSDETVSDAPEWLVWKEVFDQAKCKLKGGE